ncbi:hypothetical protein M8J76_011160 [Diaphorina citri]|nr:hypothetical protein M8J76_011160 [Diaphorina citri]
MVSGTTRQILAASSACIAAFTTGMSFAWSAPVLEELLSKESPIPMSPNEGSWVVAIIEIGNYLSPIPAGMLVNRIGRKWSLLMTGPITTASWIIAMYSRSVLGLYVMRTLQGFSMAAIYVISPMYLGEISETSIRGKTFNEIQYMFKYGKNEYMASLYSQQPLKNGNIQDNKESVVVSKI